MKNESLTSRAARPEIEKFADEAFAVARDRILAKHRAERVQVLAKVQLTHNSGGTSQP
jgi:hypothetical protein